MTVSIVPVVVLMKGPAGLPCSSCLYDLGEASGMAGAGPCPLKSALLRRHAEHRRRIMPARAASCDAFTPGFCEAEGDSVFSTGVTGAGVRLS